MSKKRKNKKNTNKKKKDCAQISIQTTDTELKIVHDLSMDKLDFVNAKIQSAHHDVLYERESGKNKVVSHIDCDGKNIHLNQMQNLKNNVDFLFAVDTNTTSINNQRTSFSVSYFVPNILNSYGSQIRFIPFLAYEINEVSLHINPERVGWHLLIQQIIKNPTYDLKQKIRIIVDSELDLLKNINDRKVSYYDIYFIPNNIQLMYASADTGKEFLANRMISLCDKMATKIAKYFIDTKVLLNDKKNGDSLFRGARRIDSKQ